VTSVSIVSGGEGDVEDDGDGGVDEIGILLRIFDPLHEIKLWDEKGVY